jgi:hypothetical protein
MTSPITDAEYATILRVCRHHGEGWLTVAELVVWVDDVKDGGASHERDLLALFMRGHLRPRIVDGELDFEPVGAMGLAS